MNRYLLDTDHVTLLSRKHAGITANLLKHAAAETVICVITVEEQLLGWTTALKQTRDRGKIESIYTHLSEAIGELAQWRIVSYSIAAMSIHDSLKRLRLNIGSNDLKIAAIALNASATVVTRNVRDFSRVPGLKFVDWSI